MYFKVDVGSETGKKFIELKGEMERCKRAVIDLIKKVGFKTSENYLSSSNTICGGLSAFCFDKEEDIPVYFGKSKIVSNCITARPLRSTKKGKILSNAMESLPVVRIGAVNDCIGFNNIFQRIGFGFYPEYILLSIGDDWKVNIPSDCKEILRSDYKRLSEVK